MALPRGNEEEGSVPSTEGAVAVGSQQHVEASSSSKDEVLAANWKPLTATAFQSPALTPAKPLSTLRSHRPAHVPLTSAGAPPAAPRSQTLLHPEGRAANAMGKTKAKQSIQ